MRPSNNAVRAATAALLAAASAATLAAAQDAPSATDQGAAPTADVILVTTLKREQDVQDVPASISVFSGGELEGFEIENIRDLSRFTPNFLGSTFTSNQPIFAIRGGTNTLSAVGANKPVGFYIDEIYVPRQNAADLELFDLERAEVLRGPQGTFFGRNVASGAVLLTTTEPSFDELTAKAQLGVGNFDLVEARALINGPLGDGVAGKLSVSHRKHTGYGEDELTGADQDDLEVFSVRGALRFALSDQTEILLSADYGNDENGGRTLAALDFGSDDPRVSTLGVNQGFERDIFGGSLRVSHQMPAGEFLSITGLRSSDADEVFSFVGLSFTQLPFAFQRVQRDEEDPLSISQEFRFVSDDAARFNYIAGLYYLYEDNDRIQDRQDLAAGSGAVIRDQLFDQNITTDAYAAYVDGTYAITDRLDVSAGLRYTFENREATLNFVDRNDASNSFLADGLEEEFDAWTPRLALTYRPTDDLTVYGSISRGFSAGGFNTEADSLNEITTPFEEETITSYEIGVKARLFGGRGVLNAVVFHQDYEDKQEFVFNPETFVGTILNAADATIQGIELEAGFDLTDTLTIQANYGYLDTEFDSFPIGSSAGNTGNQLGNSPEHQFSVIADARKPLANGAELFGNVNYSWTDDYFTGATNDPDLFVDAYGLVGAKLGYASPGDRWRLEVYGENLTDEEFIRIPSDFIIQAAHLGEPRTYGVRLTVSYN